MPEPNLPFQFLLLTFAGVDRYKRIIGPSMRARDPAGQRLEARLACPILNRIAATGCPEPEAVR
jgi:hypothetical protein